MGSKVTLWRAYWYFSKLHLDSFQADQRTKTYKVEGTQGCQATDWALTVKREEFGRKYFATPEEALLGFMDECQKTIDFNLAEIERQQQRQAMAKALLDETNG
jgi:hypothetical protein